MNAKSIRGVVWNNQRNNCSSKEPTIVKDPRVSYSQQFNTLKEVKDDCSIVKFW
jgi:hypothetical protein